MREDQDRQAFMRMISSTLAAHPDWQREAILAICQGMEAALAEANDRRSQYDLAFRCALSLADPKRLSAETKDLLNRKIIEVIGESTCQTEKDFLRRAGLSEGRLSPAETKESHAHKPEDPD